MLPMLLLQELRCEYSDGDEKDVYMLGRRGTATGSEETDDEDEDEVMPPEAAEVAEPVEAVGSLTLLEDEALPRRGALLSPASVPARSAACWAFLRAVLALARRFWNQICEAADRGARQHCTRRVEVDGVDAPTHLNATKIHANLLANGLARFCGWLGSLCEGSEGAMA